MACTGPGAMVLKDGCPDLEHSLAIARTGGTQAFGGSTSTIQADAVNGSVKSTSWLRALLTRGETA